MFSSQASPAALRRLNETVKSASSPKGETTSLYEDQDPIEREDETLDEAKAITETVNVGSLQGLTLEYFTSKKPNRPGKPPSAKETSFRITDGKKVLVDFKGDKASFMKVMRAMGIKNKSINFNLL